MGDIKVEVGLKGSALPSGKSNDKGGSIFDVIGSVFKSLKIASILTIIASIVMSFKPLMSVISNIGKMLGYLLQPISMVIMTLLYPILIILKPIMIAVNQLMAPFTKAAMQLFGEGETAKGVGVLFGGLSVVFIKVFAESIKFAGGGILIAVANLFGLVNEETKNIILNELLPAFYQAVDDTAAFLSGGVIAETAKILEGTSVDFDKFVNEAFGAVKSAYDGMSKEALEGLNQMQEDVLNKDYTAALQSMTTGMVDSWIDFGISVGFALRKMNQSWIAALGLGGEEYDQMIDDNMPWLTKAFYYNPFTRRLINVFGNLAVIYDGKQNTYEEIG